MTNSFRLFFILSVGLTLWFGCVLAFGQRLEGFSTSSGLSHNHINALATDRNGFLWLATANGLNRFNGKEFKVFKFNDKSSNSLLHNQVNDLFLRSDGKFWLATEKGVQLFDSETFYFLPQGGKQNEQNGKLPALQLVPEKDGSFFVREPRQIALYTADGRRKKTWGLSRISRFNPEGINSSCLLNGSLYIGHEDGLFVLDPESGRLSRLSEKWQKVVLFAPCDKSRLMLADRQGIKAYDPVKRTYTPVWSTNESLPSAFLCQGLNGSWLGLKNGKLWRKEFGTGIETLFESKGGNPELPSELFATALLEDNQGNVWIGTRNQGLFLFDPLSQFLSQARPVNKHNEIIKNPEFHCLAEDENSQLWVGGKGGLFFFDDQSKLLRSSPFESFWNQEIQELVSSTYGLFIATKKQIFFKKGAQVQLLFTSPEADISGLSASDCEAVFSTSKGHLYKIPFHTRGDFLPAERLPLDLPSVLPERIKILKARMGGFWFSGQNCLLHLDVKSGKLLVMNRETNLVSGLISESLHPVFEDVKNQVWLLSSAGEINLFDAQLGEFKTNPGKREFELPSADVKMLVPGKNQSIWIGTTKDLMVCNTETGLPKQISFNRKGDIYDFHFLAGFQRKSGILAAAIPEGLLFIDPSRFSISNRKPGVMIESFKVFGQELKFKEPFSAIQEIVLANRENQFSIGFTPLEHNNSQSDKIVFRLLGLETNWTEAGNRREVDYNNLDFKNYIFELKSITQDGIESQTIRLPIVLIPPFWKTGWFKGLGVFAFFILLYLLYRHQLNSVERRNRRLEDLVRMRTHQLEQLNEQLTAQSSEILEEKEKLQISNNQLLQNIEYGNRIQRAALPELKNIAHYFPDSFVLYQPKDIVSGDFYWFSDRSNRLLLAAVDCTGHGVPGAFMSLIGSEKLTKAVVEDGLENPALILDAAERDIQKMLQQGNTEAGTTDGMEAALISVEKDFRFLWFAGAHRPLFLVRNGELTEYKGSSFGLGGYWKVNEEKSFTATKVVLEPDDMIYLFSDGFTAQFHPQTGKKFTNLQFKELLLKISPFTCAQQSAMLQAEIASFAQGYGQADDILVMGLRIPPRSSMPDSEVF